VGIERLRGAFRMLINQVMFHTFAWHLSLASVPIVVIKAGYTVPIKTDSFKKKDQAKWKRNTREQCKSREAK
jgi:hypothetical protein